MSSSALISLIMKLLILAVSFSVCSAQGFFGLVGHPNGAITPVDEPAVAAARAEHLAAKGVLYAVAPVAVAGPLNYAAVPAAYAPAYGYSGPLNFNTQLIAHPNGAVVPVDEPAVAAARAEHLNAQGALFAAQTPVVAAPVAAYSAAPVASYSAAPAVAYAPAPAAYAAAPASFTGLVAHPNGAVVPIDTPAVAAARADHLLSKGVYGGVYANAAPVAVYGGLVAHPNGAIVPVDEPAVAAARAEHLALQG